MVNDKIVKLILGNHQLEILHLALIHNTSVLLEELDRGGIRLYLIQFECELLRTAQVLIKDWYQVIALGWDRTRDWVMINYASFDISSGVKSTIDFWQNLISIPDSHSKVISKTAFFWIGRSAYSVEDSGNIEVWIEWLNLDL